METSMTEAPETNNPLVQNTPKYDPQEYVSLADQTYRNFIKDGKYRDIIHGMAGLGNYSLRNQMLILHQQPDATKVNTMSGWNYNKRNIQKGSKSIKILAPIIDSMVKSENGNITAKQSDYVTGYKINFVFDIAQTQNKTEEELNETENFEPYYSVITDALKGTLKSYEFKTAEITSDGILDTRNKTVTLKTGMSDEQTLKTLVDQVAAALVVGRERKNFKGLHSNDFSEILAIEISAASAIVSKRFGLENQNLQEPDFDKMSESDINKFANNIGVARSVSQRMIMAAENAMTEVKAQEKLAEAAATELEDIFADSVPNSANRKSYAALNESMEDPLFSEAALQQELQSASKKTVRTRNKPEAEMA